MRAKHQILLIEPDATVRLALSKVLQADGYQVEEGDSYAAAFARLPTMRPDAVVVSSRLPDGNALDVLSQAKAIDPAMGFLVLADFDTLSIAVEAIQSGAEQFLMRPVDRPALLLVLQRVLENQRNRRRRLRDESLASRQPVDPFLGESKAIRALAEQARRVLAGDRPVLIRGETGTGKGVLANWLHRMGPRSEESFVDLNCAGLSREFLETELFGHEKGAFTSAVSAKTGLLEVADRGTLFLDEIGDVDAQVQPKLLKVLEEGCFRRLGDVKDRRVDTWLIAATHQDLGDLVAKKRFRSDLYFRISTILLVLPALRARVDDIPVLAEHFLKRIASELGRPVVTLTPGAAARLRSHSWPGNIRELRNVLERATLLSAGDRLEAEDLGFDFERRSTGEVEIQPDATLSEMERRWIEKTLLREQGNVGRAAQKLGISRSSLYQRIQKHRISVSRF